MVSTRASFIALKVQSLTFYSLYVYNKIDSVGIEFLDQLAREPHTAVMSCELDLGVQAVVERIWKELRLIRVYTKRYFSLTAIFYHTRHLMMTNDNALQKRRRARL